MNTLKASFKTVTHDKKERLLDKPVLEVSFSGYSMSNLIPPTREPVQDDATIYIHSPTILHSFGTREIMKDGMILFQYRNGSGKWVTTTATTCFQRDAKRPSTALNTFAIILLGTLIVSGLLALAIADIFSL